MTRTQHQVFKNRQLGEIVACFDYWVIAKTYTTVEIYHYHPTNSLKLVGNVPNRWPYIQRVWYTFQAHTREPESKVPFNLVCHRCGIRFTKEAETFLTVYLDQLKSR